MSRFNRILADERIPGILILAAILLALVAANSHLSALYATIHHAPIRIGFGPLSYQEPLIVWINQGLLTIFFLIIGLEMKRELLEGHLSTRRRAILPAVAALGGIAAPAAIYASFNWSDAAGLRGWAIPTATDVVLVLGVLTFLGRRVPAGLKAFLVALAIFDDLGAVAVIALFYGHGVQMLPLLLAATAFAALLFLNRSRRIHVLGNIVLGFTLWLGMFKSGIEPSLAGIFIASAIPLHTAGGDRASPLRITERRLHPWAAF